ncbi:MAG: hypothetical protein A2086_10025 [Spirochaetes bacterium GWD1_27_9]|nr:MAG: hypothetical protein A2Z98_13875 [Spirochaetes bacterium GWB1_27_13]OHD23718.1 MAG: hypothetical protein A2Y34_17590 [Spirochaetes bacterium GWC1_27_15]OHD42266.1 MAG: hypothetical protein A2086_10025 [Spirochaetes bacterium GWD1_27_9]
MKQKLLLVTIIAFLVAVNSFSQGFDSPFDKANLKEENIEGVITKIYEFPTMDGYTSKLAILVKTDKGDATVFLGPKWIFDSLSVKLQENDKVQITGFKYSVNGKSHIIAKELKKDDKIVTLKPMMKGFGPNKKHPFGKGKDKGGFGTGGGFHGDCPNNQF